MQCSITYILGFATVLCLISSTLLSFISVNLRDEQEINRKLDKQQQASADTSRKKRRKGRLLL